MDEFIKFFRLSKDDDIQKRFGYHRLFWYYIVGISFGGYIFIN